MKKQFLLIVLIMAGLTIKAQNVMTPELLWKLGRVSVLGISKDGKNIVYKVSTPSVAENKFNSKYFTIPVNGGNPKEVENATDLVTDKNKMNGLTLSNKEVKVEKVLGKDFFPEIR